MLSRLTRARRVAIGAAAVVAAGRAYEVYTESYLFSRVFRTVRCGLHILYAYKIAFDEDNYLDIHESVARDIYETCVENDGLYVKFGQGMASMDHLLPPPFYKHMSKLQDKAKSVSYEKISGMFEQQVGLKIEDCFLEFEREPVASASLAQVHKARLKDGRQVAVKIQKPRIQAQFSTDMFMHYLINFVLEKSFDIPLLHFVEDIKKNLKKELDFRIQAQNAKQASEKFKLLKRSQLHVPEVVDEFTKQRVMVSEWIDGIKITDDQKLRQLGFRKKDVLEKLIRAFSDQIFVTGLVHCDPHPGNIFLRPHPLNKAQFQIVILDYGLCLSLSDKFRIEYAQFWKAMFLQDEAKMKQICKSWGISQTEHFASFQLFRPYKSKKMLNKAPDRKDIIRLQLQLKDKVKEMMKETINFPKQIIFLGRNMNLVRSLNKHHGGIADRISIMANSAYMGAGVAHSNYPIPKWRYSYQLLKFNMILLALKIMNFFMELTSGKTIDEHIEDETVKQTQAMFDKYGFKSWDATSYNA